MLGREGDGSRIFRPFLTNEGINIHVYSEVQNVDARWSRQAESWYRREVDLVLGFPFVSEVIFFRDRYE